MDMIVFFPVRVPSGIFLWHCGHTAVAMVWLQSGHLWDAKLLALDMRVIGMTLYVLQLGQ